MLGAADIEPKERIVKERQQRRRTVLSQEKKPETIQQLKRGDRGAEKVNILLKQLDVIFRANHRQPIPYYKLIIDPHDFMNTVENAFQMAFLARDGNIAIESSGSDGLPHVRLAHKDELDAHPDTSQSICSLSMDLVQVRKELGKALTETEVEIFFFLITRKQVKEYQSVLPTDVCPLP